MNILVLSPQPPQATAPGAIPMVVYSGLVGLAERHTVTVVAVAGPEPHQLRQPRNALQDLGVEIHTIDRHEPQGRDRWLRRLRLSSQWLTRRWPFRTVWFWDPRVQETIDRLSTEQPFDVVITEDNAMGVYQLPSNVLRILTEHEVRRPRRISRPPVQPANWPSWALREIDWRRWERYHRSIWKKFDVVQLFTERDARAARQLTPEISDAFRVNPFSVVLPLDCHPPEPPEPNTVLFLGNFSHPPNVDAAVWLIHEIMPELRNLSPGVRLAIAGPQCPPSITSATASDVRVLGEVPDSVELMRRSSVIIAPVRIGGGMRMKVLHAMALGKAVVTTTRGVEGLGGGDSEPPVVVSDEATGMARLTADLLADPAAASRLGDSARDFAIRHHSPEAYAARLEAIIDGMRR